MFKTKHEQLQEVLNTLGPRRNSINAEEPDLVALQREHNELRMLGLEDGT